jgi:hypothetical protein
MAVKKTNKALIWTIASVLVVGAGVGLYFLLKKPKDEESSEDTAEATEDKSTSGGGGSEKKSYTPKAPAELSTPALVRDFQSLMDTKHRCWYKNSKDNKYYNICGKWADCTRVYEDGKWCGSYGAQTEKMWKKYGEEWKYLDKLVKESKKSSFIGDNSVSYEPTSSFVDENFDL